MEAGLVRIALPSLSAPSPTFKMGNLYIQALDQEFSRVYEEFTRRMASVQSLNSEIVQLWAELGTPNAQTDQTIVDNCRGSTENINVRENDLTRLRDIKQKLINEKKAREDRVAELKMQVQHLWERLGQDGAEQKAFYGSHRGYSLRVIQEWEQELDRLNEIKRDNLHIFVADARNQLQELWDQLYFHEDEMYNFEPAWSEIYTDALLEAHEMEIARLQQIVEERLPILDLVEKHQTLRNDKASLEASSQDSSRLMARGGAGEKRDPTRLLREEKMRKRIAKELPKITADLIRKLEDWEEENGVPFCIHGEPYLHTLQENQRPKSGQGAATKPANMSTSLGAGAKNPMSKANLLKTPAKVAPKPSFNTLPRAGPIVTRNPIPQRQAAKSPTPFGRPPLGQLTQGRESPERKPLVRSKTPTGNDNGSCRAKTPTSGGTMGRNNNMPAYMRQAQNMAPPKMRALDMPPPPLPPYDTKTYETSSYSHSHEQHQGSYTPSETSSNASSYMSYANRELQQLQSSSTSRVASAESAMSGATGTSSENWETFGEDSDDERETHQSYFEKLQAAKGNGKRGPEGGHYNATTGNKKFRRIPHGGVTQEIKQEPDWQSDEGF